MGEVSIAMKIVLRCTNIKEFFYSYIIVAKQKHSNTFNKKQRQTSEYAVSHNQKKDTVTLDTFNFNIKDLASAFTDFFFNTSSFMLSLRNVPYVRSSSFKESDLLFLQLVLHFFNQFRWNFKQRHFQERFIYLNTAIFLLHKMYSPLKSEILLFSNKMHKKYLFAKNWNEHSCFHT